MRSIIIMSLAAISAAFVSAEPVCIMQHAEPELEAILKSPGSVPTIESTYFIERDVAIGLPRYDPVTGEGLLPPHEALKASFIGHFADRGVSKEEFYRMATVALQKADDYTESRVADGLRKEPTPIREMWFYVVTCRWPSGREMRTPPPPALVLMNGEIVEPKVERKEIGPRRK